MGDYPQFATLLGGYLRRRERSEAWLAAAIGVNASTVNRWLTLDARPGQSELVFAIFKALDIIDPTERRALLTAAGYSYPESLLPPLGGSWGPGPPVAGGLTAPERAALAAPFMAPSLPPQGIFGRDDFLARIARLLALPDAEARDGSNRRMALGSPESSLVALASLSPSRGLGIAYPLTFIFPTSWAKSS